MINFIRKNYKYLICVLILLVILSLSFIYYKTSKEVSTTKVSKLSLVKDTNEKKETTSTVFVDVKGEVNSPGVYELDDGKRVIDAINLAGGLKEKADTINLNLSKKLTDEMYIIVYTKDEIYNFKKNNDSNEIKCASYECVCPDLKNDACIKESSLESSNTENQKVNNKISINSATKEELMNLSGIGETKAEKIIAYRNEFGLFKNIEDIKNVSGIGDSLYEKIKDNISL